MIRAHLFGDARNHEPLEVGSLCSYFYIPGRAGLLSSTACRSYIFGDLFDVF